jgi:hypothetical protein
MRRRHASVSPAHRAGWRVVNVHAKEARAVARAGADLRVSDGPLGLAVLGWRVPLCEARNPAELQE